MKDILKNLALFQIMDFCKRSSIDCAGSHIIKNGRGFKYSLIRSETSAEIVSIQFHKTRVPTFSYVR